MIGTTGTTNRVRYDLLHFSPSKFAALLEERDITSYALAKQMGVSTTWMQNLLNGKIKLPRDRYLRKLAAALRVHYSELLTDDEAKEPLTLHENGVEYSIGKEAAPNTPTERLVATQTVLLLPTNQRATLACCRVESVLRSPSLPGARLASRVAAVAGSRPE